MDDKPSLFSSRYLGRNGCQGDYEKLKITSKRKTVSQISCGWDNILWTLILGPVHTNPFSNENGAVLLRIRLSSTLQRRKRSPKTEPFENALQGGAIWKRCFLKTLFSSVDGENDAIWKRWRHQSGHDRAPDHSTVSIQNGGQTLPCGFNFAPISRTDTLKYPWFEFIWACALRV